MTAPTITALILAGRRPSGTDALDTLDVAHKGLLEFGGVPMITRVVRALLGAGLVGEIGIVAPSDLHAAFQAVLPHEADIRFISAEDTPATSVAAALQGCQQGSPVLVTTCDHALLSADMVRAFASGARAAGKDVAAGCVTRETYRARFGDAPRTFIRFSDMEFSGANLFWLDPERAGALITFWKRMEANRKKPLTMAREIGVLTGLRYLLGRLSSAAAFTAIERKTGVSCTLVALEDAAAAIDVDKPADIALVKTLLDPHTTP